LTITILAIALTATVMLSGCSTNQSDLEEYIRQIKARPRKAVPPMPTVEPFEGFSYEAGELRDPFQRTSLTAKSPSEIAPPVDHVPEPLEAFVLNQLALVGTLHQGNRQWALISAPDGQVHSVTVGNFLGRNYGQIIKVDETLLVLREIVPDGLGGWKEQSTELAMADPEQ
jgi:type IV pilus assembly protein PilP